MAPGHAFEHLPLMLRYRGRARLYGGGTSTPQTVANKAAARGKLVVAGVSFNDTAHAFKHLLYFRHKHYFI